jgi:capsular polysaccharide transport system ATP-binding protein
MVLDFDCYLVDESLSVGDKAFQEKYKSQLENKYKGKSMILVSHIENHVQKHCEIIYVLHKGDLLKFPTKKEAYDFYNHLKTDSNMEL